MTNDSFIDSQVAYYRARVAEYDEWHLRHGRFYRGEAHRRQWNLELNAVRAALNSLGALGDCLELACGTGLWTHQLANFASRLTAIDAVQEAIDINRTRVGDENVRYIVTDLFEWVPTEKFGCIFFGFWLSHVPLERFDRFWSSVRGALKPGGKVFFVDSLENQESTAIDHAQIDDSGIVERKLNDGRIFNIVKVFYMPKHLTEKLDRIGWKGKIQTTGQFFYYGCLTPKDDTAKK